VKLDGGAADGVGAPIIHRQEDARSFHRIGRLIFVHTYVYAGYAWIDAHSGTKSVTDVIHIQYEYEYCTV
jgi:hypothetical protein